MSRKKKSRKLGPLAPRKTDSPKPVKVKRLFEKKRKGLATGSRHSSADVTETQQTNHGPKDKRLGSKKPIDLTATTATTQPVEKPLTPQQPKGKLVKQQDNEKQRQQWLQELDKIENDQALQELLERYDNDEQLTAQELAQLNKMTAKHASLIEKLGLDDELDDEELIEAWENSDLKDEWS